MNKESERTSLRNATGAGPQANQIGIPQERSTSRAIWRSMKRSFERRTLSFIIMCMIILAVAPGWDTNTLVKKLVAIGAIIVHALVDVLFELNSRYRESDIERMQQLLSDVNSSCTRLTEHTKSSLDSLGENQLTHMNHATANLQELKRLAENTRIILQRYAELKRFNPAHRVHTVVLENVSRYFHRFPFTRDLYCQVLYATIQQSTTWLGIHTDSLKFFADPDPITEAYVRALAQNANRDGVKQYRLLVFDERTCKESERHLAKYRATCKGVTTFYVDKASFVPKYGKLPADLHDWALFDQCIVLQFDSKKEVMDILFDDQQFESMRDLWTELERLPQDGANVTPFRLVGEHFSF